MLGSRRIGLELIQHVFIGEHLGSLGHGAFIYNVVYVMDDRIRLQSLAPSGDRGA